jgi:hypothetical protein
VHAETVALTSPVDRVTHTASPSVALGAADALVPVAAPALTAAPPAAMSAAAPVTPAMIFQLAMVVPLVVRRLAYLAAPQFLTVS